MKTLQAAFWAGILLTGHVLADTPAIPGQSAAQAAYTTPYAFVGAVTNPSLTPDFNEMPRVFSNWQNWGNISYADWQDFHKVQELDSTWGPAYLPFYAPPNALAMDADWMRLRVMAAASVIRNLAPYAHHHISV